MRKFVKDLWQVYLPDRATKSKHLLARDDFCLLLTSGQALSYNTEKAHACKTSSPSFHQVPDMYMLLVKTQYKLFPQALIINIIYYIDADIISAVKIHFELPFLSERFHINLKAT